MAGVRLRDIGISTGFLPPGPSNAITDIRGVWVGHQTLINDQPRIARTGVTVIMPREGDIWKDNAFAGFYALNGTGEMTGIHWLEESGLLCYPIVLTNTHQVGTAHEALVAYGQRSEQTSISSLPVVAETWDGWLNDMDAFHLTQEHVITALESAKPGVVEEGNVGGGTGMICHDFKGGIGTASRLVECPSGQFTVGALVQANHGERKDLSIDGVPVGRELGYEHTPSPFPEEPSTSSSIIVVVATDAPLLPVQCKRLARRAALGLAKVGGIGHNGSGDIFLAFATGNHFPSTKTSSYDLKMLPHHHLNIFFRAVIESVEESILNALTCAQTMRGYKGHTAYALPIDDLREVMRKYGRLESASSRSS